MRHKKYIEDVAWRKSYIEISAVRTAIVLVASASGITITTGGRVWVRSIVILSNTEVCSECIFDFLIHGDVLCQAAVLQQ